ncbi:hypothetical protein D8M04_12395 [Oceanobacillus piezotolerans]|uniref:Uncharacterized protein n=1 Tax=Oceanobacillus piezotolerans TaxID=2448030 RepID=A0A498D4F5_9BACI|nr:hypothetical protein [Oceanobacillus piezotolerans]RLL43716.1 hypothetical protein D8M04_12395 [Oceanobacillus piezotolerans]
MNTTGAVRGILSRNLSNEDYLYGVVKTIKKQLREWNPNYEVEFVKKEAYELIIKNEGATYRIVISEEELDTLQKLSPYSLDRRIWSDLEQQGLEIIRGKGNYIDNVFK